MTQQLLVYVPPHPLVKHWLTVARDASTPSVLFRSAISELGRWLTYEAAREWLVTQDIMVQTPLTACPGTVIDTQVPIAVVPILRAGLGLLDGAQTVLPLAKIYHLGLVRNEETLEPSFYLNKLPEKFDPQTRVLITDPMLATGGSIMAAMAELIQRGVDPAFTRIVCVVAAPPALQKLNAAYPELTVYSATIDGEVNERGFIVPGLGDAGDRIFGT
ncbi:MAG: uracil phosphoribosyltransferase [Nostocales cyanobacterium]|nr:MAG: uracil phosphoribosyltransferase [Nostocales cyanobacterium]TAF13097.1 MAG: uracil phosphoribosyltransferase [Nostocales cyanobacterium]